MKCYKFRDKESLIGEGTRYIEIEDGYSHREVTVCDGAYLGSNIKYPRWGLMMSECQVDYDEIIAETSERDKYELQAISEQEFRESLA